MSEWLTGGEREGEKEQAEGEREAQEEGDICILTADSHCCIA